ncbi:MAG: protein kinase, partial [Myxococcota bacterium]
MKAGDQISRYVVLGKLATGGMAEVWLARQSGPAGFSKTLVLKTISADLRETGNFVQMFLEEARLAALINHPNVVQIFDLGEDQGEYFIAMEYLEGRSLYQVAKTLKARHELMPPALAARVVADCCAGLDHAHDLKDGQGAPLNIIHRDVSLENILVTYTGQVKMVDFGIAKAADSANRTRPGTVRGKANYLAPEQVLCHPLDRRVDTYALGVCLYAMTTGTMPFTAGTDLDVMRAIVDKPPPLPHMQNPAIPPALESIMLRALQKNAADRFPTARAMRDALEDFLKDQPGSSSYHLATLMDGLFPASSDETRRRAAALAGAPTPAATVTPQEAIITVGRTEPTPAAAKNAPSPPEPRVEDGPTLPGTSGSAGSSAEELAASDSPTLPGARIPVDLSSQLEPDEAHADRPPIPLGTSPTVHDEATMLVAGRGERRAKAKPSRMALGGAAALGVLAMAVVLLRPGSSAPPVESTPATTPTPAPA